MQEYYKILNITEDASIEEIEQAYKSLKQKYSEERFLEGERGNEAAKNLTKLETAYNEIMANKRKYSEKDEFFGYDFSEVEALIKAGKIDLAQQKLDDANDRNAEWHYLQSVIFYKKNWTNESKKQLEIAISKDPQNPKYSEAYAKLKQRMEFNERQYYSGNTQYNGQYDNQRQMGGTDMNNCCSFCATWCCMDMMCSMCCR